MPLQAVEPLRLYRQIAGQIAALIEQGEYQVGAKLPAERELAGLLGVSRTSVREAIISLELAGLVEVRVGTGIYVRSTAPARSASQVASASNDSGPGPFELLSARAMIEGETAALAARTRTKSDLAALRATIDRMRRHDDDFATRDAADREFHERIAAATGNGALAWVVSNLWEQRHTELWTRIESHFHTPALRARTLVDHQAIADAIDARDGEGARQAMRRHLSRVAREFQRKIDSQPEAAGGTGAHAARERPGASPRKAARRTTRPD